MEDGENQRGFAEIEVTPEAILIRCTLTDELPECLEDIAAKLRNARHGRDDGEMTAEDAFHDAIGAIVIALDEMAQFYRAKRRIIQSGR